MSFRSAAHVDLLPNGKSDIQLESPIVTDVWIPIQFINASNQSHSLSESARSRSTPATGPAMRSHEAQADPHPKFRRGDQERLLVLGRGVREFTKRVNGNGFNILSLKGIFKLH